LTQKPPTHDEPGITAQEPLPPSPLQAGGKPFWLQALTPPTINIEQP
jgi:hypothetical protein